MSDSILTSIKQLLGMAEGYTDFDGEVTMFINSALANLVQIGVGPDIGFSITDKTAVWSDFTPDIVLLAGVRSYVYLSVRLVFDPPATSFTIEAFQKQLDELTWRLNIATESIHPPSDPFAVTT